MGENEKQLSYQTGNIVKLRGPSGSDSALLNLQERSILLNLPYFYNYIISTKINPLRDIKI